MLYLWRMAKQKENPAEEKLAMIGWKERWAAYRAFLGTMWRANPALAFVRFFLIFISNRFAIFEPEIPKTF